jgi:hypothetical protein
LYSASAVKTGVLHVGTDGAVNSYNITAICALGLHTVAYSTTDGCWIADIGPVLANTNSYTTNFGLIPDVGSAISIVGLRNSSSNTPTANKNNEIWYSPIILLATTTAIFRAGDTKFISDSFAMTSSTDITPAMISTTINALAPNNIGADGTFITVATSVYPYKAALSIVNENETTLTTTLINIKDVILGRAKSLASSANGQIVYVCATDNNGSSGTYGYVYKSSNAGATWAQTSAGNHQYKFVVCDQSGQYVAAAYINGASSKVILSDNFGSVWADMSFDSKPWSGLTMNSTGTRISVAGDTVIQAAVNGAVDGRLTYTHPANTINAMAASLDGKYAIMNDTGNRVYVSSDYAKTFTATSLSSRAWSGIAVDTTGQYMVAAVYNGGV